jgi:hypothetical protein
LGELCIDEVMIILICVINEWYAPMRTELTF